MTQEPIRKARSHWTDLAAKLALTAALTVPAAIQTQAQTLPAGVAPVTVFKNAHLLVDAAWLAARLGQPNLVIIDARSQAQFLRGHIPGAALLGGSGALVDSASPIDGMLLGSQDFQALARSLGINQDSEVVIYDAGNSQASARLFYALEYYGHADKAKILDGGFAAWTETASRPLSVEPQAVVAGNFLAAPNVNLVTTADQIVANFDDPNVIFLDTRSAGEFNGTDVRAAEGGHIPGAIHLEWTNNIVSGSVQRFKSPAELGALYASLGLTPDVKIVPYCQTNIRGSHTYFVLRLLGFTDVSPYEASWAEYGNTPNLPKALTALR